MPEATRLGVSTAGHRKHRQGDQDSIRRATLRVLKTIETDSTFFDQMEPQTLPTFDGNTLECGDFLGKGEFGFVSAVEALHVPQQCPCPKCKGPVSGPASTTSLPKKIKLVPRKPTPPPTEETDSGTRTVEIVGPQEGGLEQAMKNAQKHAAPGSSKRPNRLNSRISFAEDVKFNDDDSTISTVEDEYILEEDGIDDSYLKEEMMYLQGYMATHCSRHGCPRYAVKRLRDDLSSEMQLEAAVDLAVEAKFLTSIRHPNIVKMRGTVGTPGSLDFMIIMDCLVMTLRDKMQQWNEESKKHSKGLLGRLLPSRQNRNDAMRHDQYADKLLAVFDIARAMRYLHNNRIIFRDLKPENVAFDIRGDMRLFDFGLAKELKAKDLVEPPETFAATGLTGSRRYMAPEVVLCKDYGWKADVFSYAIVFWEVFSGKDAFPNHDFDKHFDHVVMKGKRPNLRAAKHLSKALGHMLQEMWNGEPRERPSFRRICDNLSSEYILRQEQRGVENAKTYKDGDNRANNMSDRTNYLMNRSLRSRAESDHSMASGNMAGDSSFIVKPERH